MGTGEWSLAGLHDVLAAAVPDRTMLICGDVRRSYAEVVDRSRSIAAFLVERGLGVRRERHDLERWESGQDAVALVLQNCTEYVEAMYGAFRARAVPFNVNQHYRPAEIASLFGDLDVQAVVYHRALGPLVEQALRGRSVVLIDVDDGSGVAPLAGSTPFEEAAATDVDALPEPSPDDLYVVCTGGTTGRPKAVMWRQADAFIAAMSGAEGLTDEAVAAAALANSSGPSYAVPPLMHAAAQWTAFAGIHNGAGAAFHDDTGPFDPATIVGTAARERVGLMSIVGDAYAGPIVEELQRSTYDLSALRILATGGAATGEQHKAALLELLPHLVIVDGYGASETGGMAFGARSAQGGAEGFNPSAGATVISADRRRFLDPGDEEVGWTARRGRVPLGYLNDPDRTQATFPIVDGERLAIPGDRAQLLSDGNIRMLGRDAMVVNTGGEKVYVEEVEDVLRRHPAVLDALVVGRPSARFGQEVVGVVSLRVGVDVDLVDLRDHVSSELARFKAPRAILVCDVVRRHANGKADYTWARAAAADAVDVTVVTR